MAKHWTEKLFIDEAELFKTTLVERMGRTEAEIDGLLNIFSEYSVPKKAAILDLACGIGRHSVPLAEKGYKVVGVDLSPSYISAAEKYAEDRGVSQNTRFIVGDMKRLEELLSDSMESFDAVVNLFTSMGYWDEETDRTIFTQALNLVRPQGLLVIHTANRDFLIKNFQARDFTISEEGRVFFTERRLDLETSRIYNVWRYYDMKGEDMTHLSTVEIDHRLYSLHELKKLVEDSGWRYQTCYGGFGTQPFTIDTFSMLLIAKKP